MGGESQQCSAHGAEEIRNPVINIGAGNNLLELFTPTGD